MKNTVTRPNFAKAQAAMIAITTGLAMLAVLAIQTMIWGMEAYAIPVAHRSIVAIAKAIKAKPPQSEPNALKELSPSVDSFNYTNEQFIEANRQVWEWELAEKWEETESIQIPNPEPTPQPIPDNVAIAEPAPKPKAKSKQSPKPKGIATLIITEASK